MTCVSFINSLNKSFNCNFYDNPPINNSYIKLSSENEVWWTNTLRYSSDNYYVYIAKLKLLLSFGIISSDKCILNNIPLDLFEKISNNIKESYQKIIKIKLEIQDYHAYLDRRERVEEYLSKIKKEYIYDKL